MSNNGAIFYINADGNPVCFDNEKKIVSDRVFNNVCADGEYVYCTNKKVTYRGDPGDESLGSPFLQACFIAAAGMVTFENAYIFCESVKRTA